MPTALKDANTTEDREDLNEALFQLDKARRESRIASFRSALDHGVSINELARLWGFSRQMASRYAKEARRASRATRLHATCVAVRVEIEGSTAVSVEPGSATSLRTRRQARSLYFEPSRCHAPQRCEHP